MKMEEGYVYGLVEGKVVIKSKDLDTVINELNKHPDKEVTLTSIPRSDIIHI